MNTETELLALAEKIGAKITQLKYYRDNECQLDHARAIAEGRISQANQIQHWISVLLNAPAQCTLASNATTISCSGKDITIACDDHDTKQAVMDALTGDGEPFGYYYWKSNGDGTESPDFSEREIPSFKCGVRDVVPLYAHPAPLADEAGMREALQLGLEAVTESFEHASTYDDQLLAEARHRSISTALRPSQAAAVLPAASADAVRAADAAFMDVMLDETQPGTRLEIRHRALAAALTAAVPPRGEEMRSEISDLICRELNCNCEGDGDGADTSKARCWKLADAILALRREG